MFHDMFSPDLDGYQGTNHFGPFVGALDSH
jgi:hypothetical protein